MKKKALSMLLCGTMLISLSAGVIGCGKEEETKEVATTATATTEEITTEEPDIGPEGCKRSHLTGEWIDEKLADRRPVAFMFENSAASVPSYGSSNASVYYEAEAEGGITRIMCIYDDYSGMEKIGNIRSTRPYFAYTSIAFDAILAHCGGSIETYNNIIDCGLIDDIDAYKSNVGYYRSSDRSAPENLYTSSEGVDEAIAAKGIERDHPEYEGYFNFNKDDEHEIQLEDGTDCVVITPYQANCKPWFVYNEEDGLYYRYEFRKEQVDALTGEQLSVKNILIQECDVEAYFDEQNHDRVETTITGSGHGYYVTNGKAMEITWKCEEQGRETHYYDKDGNEIKINQGKTWIDIVDTDNAENIKIYATEEEYQAAK